MLTVEGGHKANCLDILDILDILDYRGQLIENRRGAMLDNALANLRKKLPGRPIGARPPFVGAYPK